ncbi:MAG: 16S rRNA (guanine(527)-N(7))-methyltransferase RsmG [bacterium]
MNQEDFIYRMKEGLSLMSLPLLSEDKLNLLFYYFLLLQKWNQKLNLTAHREEEESIEKNFLDCLSLIPHLDYSKEVMDLGSGAGFPGLVVKISLPHTLITLVEAIQKKSAFLSTVVRDLNLKEVEIQTTHLHTENFNQLGFRNRFDAIVSRATISINKILPLISLCLKKSGIFIGMVSEEFSETETLNPPLFLTIEKEISYQLPFSKLNRKLILFRKMADESDNN